MDLTPILRPGSIAIVGAIPRSFVGRVALENSRALGFQGHLYPVNPKYPEIGGLPAAASLSSLPEAPDVVLVQLGTDRILEAVREGVAVGARGCVIPGAGYTDSGPAALELAAELRTLASERGIAVVGTNCMGFVDLVTGAAPYIGTVPMHVRRGRVGVVAQSGAIVEAFGDPTGFLVAARSLAEAGKPLAVCKVGRSSAAQAGIVAHSGKLAGNARVGAAALRQAGAILCADVDELTTIGEIFGAGRTRMGRRAHIVTNSGGEANLLSDLAEDVGIELPPLSEAGAARLTATWPSGCSTTRSSGGCSERPAAGRSPMMASWSRSSASRRSAKTTRRSPRRTSTRSWSAASGPWPWTRWSSGPTPRRPTSRAGSPTAEPALERAAREVMNG